MTVHLAKRIIKIFSVLNLISGSALLLLVGYLTIRCVGSWIAILITLHILIAPAFYLLWLGYRGLSSPTPSVVKQTCNVMPFIVMFGFCAPVTSAGWAEDSVFIPSVMTVAVLTSFVFSIFGAKILCRQLFPLEVLSPCPSGANADSHG